MFAARAHSLFDGESWGDIGPFDYDDFADYAPGLRARVAEMRMRAALSTPRVFDTEDGASVEVLNQTVDTMRVNVTREPVFSPLLREEASTGTDAIQAADVAAGTARDIIDRNGVRALADRFRRVFVNGIDLQKLLRA